MHCVYVLKKLKSKKLCVGLTDDFGREFEKNQKCVLISIKFFRDKKEAGKLEKHLKSRKGLADFKLKIKKKSLGIMG